MTIWPASVSSVTHCFDICSTVALSKGSAAAVSASGRAFFFAGGASCRSRAAGGRASGCCARAVGARLAAQSIETRTHFVKVISSASSEDES
jgi:hypothetical protein